MSKTTRSASSLLVADSLKSATKRSREDLTDVGPEEVSNLQQLWEKIEAKIDSFNTQLSQRIDSVEQQISSLRTECTDQIRSLDAAVGEIRSEITESSELLAKSREVIISGIPFVPQENLPGLFETISNTLGFTHCPVVNLQRLAKFPVLAGSRPPILCEFALKGAKSEFYRRYIQFRSLSLRHVGFESEERIYINDNLSISTRKIRAEAIKLKKNNKLEKISTRDGVVYVKKHDQPEMIAIKNIDQLSSILNETPS